MMAWILFEFDSAFFLLINSSRGKRKESVLPVPVRDLHYQIRKQGYEMVGTKVLSYDVLLDDDLIVI